MFRGICLSSRAKFSGNWNDLFNVDIRRYTACIFAYYYYTTLHYIIVLLYSTFCHHYLTHYISGTMAETLLFYYSNLLASQSYVFQIFQSILYSICSTKTYYQITTLFPCECTIRILFNSTLLRYLSNTRNYTLFHYYTTDTLSYTTATTLFSLLPLSSTCFFNAKLLF